MKNGRERTKGGTKGKKVETKHEEREGSLDEAVPGEGHKKKGEGCFTVSPGGKRGKPKNLALLSSFWKQVRGTERHRNQKKRKRAKGTLERKLVACSQEKPTSIRMYVQKKKRNNKKEEQDEQTKDGLFKVCRLLKRRVSSRSTSGIIDIYKEGREMCRGRKKDV